MGGPIGWLRVRGERIAHPLSGSASSRVSTTGASRTDAIAALRDEIGRLQQELVVLSKADEGLRSGQARKETETSTANAERGLLEAQRELAKYQARI
jgi:hypothetical protein